MQPIPDTLSPSLNQSLLETIGNTSKTAWEQEYRYLNSIPSSHRTTPSHALIKYLSRHAVGNNSSKVLDLGCGSGRNSFYFANMGFDVTALDFSPTALGVLQSAKCDSAQALKNLKTIDHDIESGLPFDNRSFDVVLDAYCLCHFIDPESYQSALAECYRILKPGGLLLKLHLSNQDSYYKDRVYKYTQFGHVSFDPINGIYKNHYSINSYVKSLEQIGFTLEASELVNFSDKVGAHSYKRTVFACGMLK